MAVFIRVFAIALLLALPLAAAQPAEQAALEKAASDLRRQFPDLPTGITTPQQLTSALEKSLSELKPAAQADRAAQAAAELRKQFPQIPSGITTPQQLTSALEKGLSGVTPAAQPARAAEDAIRKAASDLRSQFPALPADIQTPEQLTAAIEKGLSNAQADPATRDAIQKAASDLRKRFPELPADIQTPQQLASELQKRLLGLNPGAQKDPKKKAGKKGGEAVGPEMSPVSVPEISPEGTIAETGTEGSAVSSPEASPQTPSRNEGCVAVEHLDGFVLQHPNHLMRPVLCANGFCATPNHAIEVNGEYTSMKRLCAGEWECTKSVKLVNNLKVAANRRARISEDIVVTPYDFRFPKVAVWGVQMLEDVWNMLALSVCSGTLAGAAVLLLSKTGTANKL